MPLRIPPFRSLDIDPTATGWSNAFGLPPRRPVMAKSSSWASYWHSASSLRPWTIPRVSTCSNRHNVAHTIAIMTRPSLALHPITGSTKVGAKATLSKPTCRWCLASILALPHYPVPSFHLLLHVLARLRADFFSELNSASRPCCLRKITLAPRPTPSHRSEPGLFSTWCALLHRRVYVSDSLPTLIRT